MRILAGTVPLFSTGGGKPLTPPTFARTGTAYLDGVSYAANTARFPNTAGTVGVLVEEATTNGVAYSSEFDNAWWTKTRATVTANAVAAPDGTLTADKIVEDSTASNTHFISRSALVVTGQPESLSVYAKAAERSWIAIGDTVGNAVFFNLATGVIGTTNGTVSGASITSAGNGWYRCTVSRSSATSTLMGVYLANADNSPTYSGDGASGVYLWGAQQEQKAYATTYVPTSGATATRNAETLTIPTAGIMKPDQGTVIVRQYFDGDLIAASASTAHYLFSPGNSASTNQLYLRRTGNNLQMVTSDGVPASSSVSYPRTFTQGWHIVGARYSVAELSIWYDGIKGAATAGPINLPASLQANASIGTLTGGSGPISQPIAYVALYDRALSDAEMAAATSGSILGGYTALVDFRGGVLRASQFGGNTIFDPDLFTNAFVNQF